jgi:uncharacterized coiled-coil DUF342 family protein
MEEQQNSILSLKGETDGYKKVIMLLEKQLVYFTGKRDETTKKANSMEQILFVNSNMLDSCYPPYEDAKKDLEESRKKLNNLKRKNIGDEGGRKRRKT